MTFLPIAVRELSVAARRPATYWLRAAAVLIGLLLFCVVYHERNSPGRSGHTVFFALGTATLGFSLLAGFLLTSESIAGEKQGGTLGLLFLTDLKGYDIVLGKLAAHSVNALFALIAVFPVLALPFLMGSVTGLEFSRMLLVFGTTLLFSLSLGLAVSANSSEPKHALGWAIFLMTFVAGILPALWWLQRLSLKTQWFDFLLWPSPATAFQFALDDYHRLSYGAAIFRHSLGTIWVMTVLCLLWACFITERAWRTDEPKPAKRRWFGRRIRPGKIKPRGWAQAEAANPFCRVTILDRAPSSMAKRLIYFVLPVWLCFFCSIPWASPSMPVAFIICFILAFGMHVLVKLLMTVESVSRINHDRNSGALELLLATPLPVESIIAAQRKAMRAHFQTPLWTLCLMNLALIAAVFCFPKALDTTDPRSQWIFTELFLGGVIALLVDFESLLWVGMWHGLSRRQVYKAVIRTAVQLLGPCWLLIFIFFVTRPDMSENDTAIMIALWFLVGILIDTASIVIARFRLLKRFRTVAAQRYDKPA